MNAITPDGMAIGSGKKVPRKRTVPKLKTKAEAIVGAASPGDQILVGGAQHEIPQHFALARARR